MNKFKISYITLFSCFCTYVYAQDSTFSNLDKTMLETVNLEREMQEYHRNWSEEQKNLNAQIELISNYNNLLQTKLKNQDAVLKKIKTDISVLSRKIEKDKSDEKKLNNFFNSVYAKLTSSRFAKSALPKVYLSKDFSVKSLSEKLNIILETLELLKAQEQQVSFSEKSVGGAVKGVFLDCDKNGVSTITIQNAGGANAK